MKACHTIVAIAFVALASGCTSVIIPPVDPEDPVSVFVLDHGRHSSLVLPDEDGGSIRYSYGDWDYYALNRTGLGSGLRALLWPTPAALGRQRLTEAADADNMHRLLRVTVVQSHELKVATAAVRKLRDELGSRFEAAADSLHYSAAYDVYFVHHAEPYTFGYNSNRMVARWLEQLGCTVIGRPVLSNWRIDREASPG